MPTENAPPEPASLEELLARIEEATAEGERVTLDAIVDALGRRAFGPLLLLAGLITLMPLVGDIPGVPTVMAILVLVTAGQLLISREHFWLPRWGLERSVERKKLERALAWLRRPARILDRWLRPRLQRLVQGVGLQVVAVICIAIAAAMPVMELIPFSANIAGLALTTFGLALVTRDGLLALFALIVTFGGLGLVAYQLS